MLSITNFGGIYTIESSIYNALFTNSDIEVQSYLPDSMEQLFDILLAKNEQDLHGLLRDEPRSIQFIGDIHDYLIPESQAFVGRSLGSYYKDNEHVQFIMGYSEDINLDFIGFLSETTYATIDDNVVDVLTQVINMINRAPEGYHRLIDMMHEKTDAFYMGNLIKILH